MPHHVHMILGTSGIMKLEDIIRDLKSFTSRRIREQLEDRSEIDLKASAYLAELDKSSRKKGKGFQMWQYRYHGVELSTNFMIEQRLNYIHYNPVKAGLVENPEEWKWSSALDYYGGKGLLDIMLL